MLLENTQLCNCCLEATNCLESGLHSMLPNQFNQLLQRKDILQVNLTYITEKGNMVSEFHYNTKLREFATQFEQWQEEEEKRATNAKMTILQILQFPGGWLCDAEDGAVSFELPVNQDRSRQLHVLRKLYTPDLFYMLHMVLYETGQYTERYVLLTSKSKR